MSSERQEGLGFVIGLLLLGVVGAGGWYLLQREPEAPPAAMVASGGQLTAGEAGRGDTAFARQESPELWYQVTLAEAPLGATAELVGEWVDPAGKVAHRNRFVTQPITHLPWRTHVRFRLPADAPPGRWRVRLLSGDREIQGLPFVVTGEGPR